MDITQRYRALMDLHSLTHSLILIGSMRTLLFIVSSSSDVLENYSQLFQSTFYCFFFLQFFKPKSPSLKSQTLVMILLLCS